MNFSWAKHHLPITARESSYWEPCLEICCYFWNSPFNTTEAGPIIAIVIVRAKVEAAIEFTGHPVSRPTRGQIECF